MTSDYQNHARMKVNLHAIDPDKLKEATDALIDALSPYPVEIKAAALHTARASFPVPFDVLEVERDE